MSVATPHDVAELLGRADAVAGQLAARADEHDRAGSLPQASIDDLWAAGIANLTLPAEHGGPGTDLATTARAVARVSAGDASVGLVWVMHLVHLELLTAADPAWPAAARDRVIASALDGPALINAVRVEPELGTPARGGVPATRATAGVDDAGRSVWRISGRKTFSTGSTALRWMLVWAATADDDPAGVRIGPFLVDARAPGIAIEETWDHHGMRASASHDVLFDQTPLPRDAAGPLVAVTEGRAAGRDDVAAARMIVLLAAVYVGVATAARDWLVGYLHERVPTNLGASLATLPRFQAAVGRIQARIATAERLVADLATDLDRGGSDAADAARRAGLVKVVASEQLIAAVDEAVALVGNAGLTRRHPLQRHLRDVLCSRVHTPQDDAVLLTAGRAALDAAAPTRGA